uniref:Uncharacterized protein n=1 Tax=Glossina austeni TaxID=7395 RepID=A0A1A9VT03_GLOAU
MFDICFVTVRRKIVNDLHNVGSSDSYYDYLYYRSTATNTNCILSAALKKLLHLQQRDTRFSAFLQTANAMEKLAYVQTMQVLKEVVIKCEEKVSIKGSSNKMRGKMKEIVIKCEENPFSIKLSAYCCKPRARNHSHTILLCGGILLYHVICGATVISSGAKLTFGTLRADFNLVVVVFDDEQVDDVVEFVGVSMLIAATPTDILLINDDIPVVGYCGGDDGGDDDGDGDDVQCSGSQKSSGTVEHQYRAEERPISSSRHKIFQNDRNGKKLQNDDQEIKAPSNIGDQDSFLANAKRLETTELRCPLYFM